MTNGREVRAGALIMPQDDGKLGLVTSALLNRRTLLAATAFAIGGAAGPAPTPEPGLFDNTPLANNRVAKGFHPVPRDLAFPNAVLLGRDGPHHPKEWHGKVRIVSLWAEWCIPCLSEAPDLAALSRRHSGLDVALVSVLTHSQKKLDLDGAEALLAKVNAESLSLLIEPDGGDRLFSAVAQRNGHPALPCNLLIDPKGRIRGRNFGAAPADPEAQKRVMATIKFGPGGSIPHEDMERLFAASKGTAWSTPDADAFIEALAKGALEKV